MSSLFERRKLRTGVFIDVGNIHASIRNKYDGKEPDHVQLLKTGLAENQLYRAVAYCIDMGGHLDRWKHALSHYGFEFVVKPLTKFSDGTGKGDVDMELAMDVWRHIDVIDMVVLITGDGDFTELVKRCRELGKIVRVIGVPETTSRHLIEAANEYEPITEEMMRDRKQPKAEKAEKPEEAKT